MTGVDVLLPNPRSLASLVPVDIGMSFGATGVAGFMKVA